MEREQFTFYASFFAATQRIRKAADRCAAYDAICSYALSGALPDMDSLPDAAAIAFELIRPILDSGKRKAQSGKAGGKQNGSKAEANEKQTESKAEAREAEANQKQGESGSKKEDKKEDKKEGEKEKENECSVSPPAPSFHKRSPNGWVKLTDEQYANLLNTLGESELARCIAYIDELAQSTGNKNGWKDWNLVIRRCAREGWGKRAAVVNNPKFMSSGAQKPLDADGWDKILDSI